jgi:hypothetical protein
MKILLIFSLTVLAYAFFSPAAIADVTPANPSDIVTLDTTLGFVDPQPPCPGNTRLVDSRILSDDTVVPFSIPAGMVLVINSADFYGSGLADRNYEFQLFGTGPGGPLVVANGRSDPTGQVMGNVTLRTGVVVKPDVILCARAVSLSVGQIPAFVRVHGFFTRDR